MSHFNTFEKFDNRQLIDFVIKNGYKELGVIVKEKQIDGQQFLSLREFEVMRWKVPTVEKRKLWSSIVEIQQNSQNSILKTNQNVTKKVNTQHQTTKQKLEMVFNKNQFPVQKPVKKSPVSESPPQEDYIPMNKPPPVPPREAEYDENGYLNPIQTKPLGKMPTPISERKPWALPRDFPPLSPKLHPRRITNTPNTPNVKQTEEETYEAPPTVYKNIEVSHDEDETYEPAPEASKGNFVEDLMATSQSGTLKKIKSTLKNCLGKIRKTSKEQIGDENEIRPLPSLPPTPPAPPVPPARSLPSFTGQEENRSIGRTRVLSPDTYYSSADYEEEPDRTPSSEAIYTNEELEEPPPIKNFAQRRGTIATTNTLPLPPRKKIIEHVTSSLQRSKKFQSSSQEELKQPQVKNFQHGEETSFQRGTNATLSLPLKKKSYANLSSIVTNVEGRTSSSEVIYTNNEEIKEAQSVKIQELSKFIKDNLNLTPTSARSFHRKKRAPSPEATEEAQPTNITVSSKLGLRLPLTPTPPSFYQKNQTPSPEAIYSNEEIEESQQSTISSKNPRINNQLLSTKISLHNKGLPSPETPYNNEESEETQWVKNVGQKSPIDSLPLPLKLKILLEERNQKLTSPENTNNKLPKPPNTFPLEPLSFQEICEDQSEDDEDEDYSYNLNDEPYYRVTDRKGAKLLLQDLEDGAFLFRPSKMFFLTLSLKEGDKIYNLPIEKGENNMFRLDPRGNRVSLEFPTLNKLINHFSREVLSFKTRDGRFVNMYLKKVLPHDRF